MERALQLAAKAAMLGEVPVGAIVYETDTGRVLGECYNTREQSRNPRTPSNSPSLKLLTKSATGRLDSCTLVVTLEPGTKWPGAIVNARVGRVVFGAMDPKAGFVGSLGNLLEDDRLNHRVKAIAGVNSDKSGSLLKQFFATLRGQEQARNVPINASLDNQFLVFLCSS